MRYLLRTSVVLTPLTPGQQGQTMDRSVNTDWVKSIKSMGQHHVSCSCGDNWDLPSSDYIKIFRAFEYLKCIVYCPIRESQYYCIFFARLTSKRGKCLHEHTLWHKKLREQFTFKPLINTVNDNISFCYLFSRRNANQQGPCSLSL